MHVQWANHSIKSNHNCIFSCIFVTIFDLLSKSADSGSTSGRHAFTPVMSISHIVPNL